MELRNLNTVRTIVETGSFQKAAVALNYAQSTITFQIRQLEQEFGITLFEKSENRMKLTAEGEELYPMILQILRDQDQLLAYRRNDQPTGELLISMPESLVTYKMQPVLRRFRKEAPLVNLRLHILNCYAIYDEIAEGDTDIAIHYDVKKYPGSFTLQPLCAYPLALVGSPELDNASRDFITPNQRKALCSIQNDPHALYFKKFTRYLRQKNITLASEMELWSIESVKQSVMSNLGVAMLPRFTVEQELASGTLIELPTEMEEPEITAVYVYNRNKWDSPASKLYRNITFAHFHVDSDEK